MKGVHVMNTTFSEWLREFYSEIEISFMNEDDISLLRAEYNCECNLLGVGRN